MQRAVSGRVPSRFASDWRDQHKDDDDDNDDDDDDEVEEEEQADEEKLLPIIVPVL
jgi:hypothetical protein